MKSLARSHDRSSSTRASSQRRRPRGAILIAALMCVFVIGIMSVSATKAMIQQARQTKQLDRQQQAYWIAVSALDRAAAQLRKSESYRGETWSILADEVDGRHGGVATIRVEPADDNPSLVTVTIEAAYPADPMQRVTVEKQERISLVPTGDRS